MAESSADRRTDVNVGNARPSRALLTSLHPSGDPAEIRWIDGPEDPSTTENKGDVVVLAMTCAHCRDAGQREAMIKRGLSALAPGGIPVDRRAGTMAVGACDRSSRAGPGHRQPDCSSRPRRSPGRILPDQPRTSFRTEQRPCVSALAAGACRPRTGALGNSHALSAASGCRLLRVPCRNQDFRLVGRSTGFRARYGRRGDHRLARRTGTILIFALGKDQTVVVKRGGHGCHAQIAHEAAMLKQFGAGLAKSGLEVPRLIDCTTTARFCSLIETHVPGRPMDSLFRDSRHRDVGAIAGRLAEWLSQWNRQTLRHVELTPALGELLILSAARELAGTIDRGSAYVEWLSGKTAQLIGHKVPLVAAHNDLTMANVLGDLSGIRSVIDWEAADPDGLPLTDFRYASCDAATAIGAETAWRHFAPALSTRANHGSVCNNARRSCARSRADRPNGWSFAFTPAGFVTPPTNRRDRRHASTAPSSRLPTCWPTAWSVTEPAGSCGRQRPPGYFVRSFRRCQAIPAAVRLARAGA